MFLATDLDGTFLGGRRNDRLALYSTIRGATDIRLAFVTGRGVESILPLLNDPLIPRPEFLIADVGATVLTGDSLQPVQPLQLEIDRRWVGEAVIRDRLSTLSGVTMQQVPQERRCSFFVEDPAVIEAVRERLADLDCDVLHSAGRYLDVLPAGVSKGSSLLRLLEVIEQDPAEVLVAGDTLNDLSLFETGLRGVVVGNSEPALVSAVADREAVLVAGGDGARGIMEGAAHHGFLESTPSPAIIDQVGEASLVVAYHRLPFEEKEVDGTVVRRPPASPNGIIPTLLSCFSTGRAGSWIAWSNPGEDGTVPRHTMVDEDRYPNLIASRVPLAEADVQRFYKSFSKKAFWPVIFSFVDRAEFSQADWDHFVEVNRLFAERAAADAERGAVAWIHDYNLWMVPAFLRQLRPDLRISFFHHTAFPPADVFNVIPWADQIVASLVQCDHVGFHIPRYVANFVDVLRSHLPVEVNATQPCAPRWRIRGVALAQEEIPTELEVAGRPIRLGAYPVGIDGPAIEDILAQPERQDAVQRLKQQFAGCQMILSVERLDYVKGPLQKLEAFERFLGQHPEFRERVVLVFVTTPPAAGMVVYDELRHQVDQTVGRINGRFGTLEWTPVNYLFRSLPFEEVATYYAAADLAWITPLRDGLNLVAKEYVAAQEATGGRGILVLSEFAGAAVELHGAVLTNPYDVENLSRVLHEALTMPPDERAHRMRRLGRIALRYDVHEWTREVLAASRGRPEPSPVG
ncbi:MAG: glucosylglycerol-phosphate synthase [Gemmatimonadales bacterium]